MGGVTPATLWNRCYEITVDKWHQKIEATIDPSRRSIVILNTIHLVHDDLPANHPFRNVIGTKICNLDSVDLGQAIAEVDRVLKPSRRWCFWTIYRPNIRVVHPRGGKNRFGLGLVVANPSEQKKLLEFFRTALAVLEEKD
jgi:hypothetical protein